jgi:peroxiredoxin
MRRISKSCLVLFLYLVFASAQGSLSDFDGRTFKLSEYIGNGNWTLVIIWSSTCGTCRREAPRIEAFHQRHDNAGVQVLGISVDSLEGVVNARRFVRQHHLTFPNLLGSPEDVALLYLDTTGTHLLGTPGFLLFNPQGRLRTFGVGPIDVDRLDRTVGEISLVR